MKPFYMPTTSPDDWRQFLADPDKHWKSGFSAKELAYAWEQANGWPEEVRRLIKSCPELTDLEILLAVPEHKVPLPGGGNPSQNDLFVLAGDANGLVVIMVEGKVAESFGGTLGEWRQNASPGKRQRLEYLQRKLGVTGELPESLRYQLLHRSASALIEADRFHARAAVMLVHSFSPDHHWFEDYAAFLQLFGVTAELERFQAIPSATSVPFYAGWASGTRSAPSEASDKKF